MRRVIAGLDPKPAIVTLFLAVEYFLKQYGLQQGALEIQYIEEFFLDFPRKKTAARSSTASPTAITRS